MNPHAERRRFDELDRVELLESIHIISAKLRAARADLQAARGVDRDEVARIRQRVLKLATAVSAAQLELAKRNAQRHSAEDFVRAAREHLAPEVFKRIDRAAHAVA